MNKTFAQVAEMLGNKQAKFEERLNKASDSIARNSAQRMLDRIEDSKDRLFNSQEALKVPQAPVGVSQFGAGGETDPPTSEAEKEKALKEYQEAYAHHAKMRQAIGTNDTELLNATPGAKWGPYTTNDLTSDLARAQELRKKAGLGLVEDAKLTLPHAGQQIRGTFNQLAGTHYGSGGNVSQHGWGADLLKKASGWVSDNKGAIGDTINSVMPFVDNAYASKTINNMQAPVDPILQKSAQINTNYNINPQLLANRDTNTILNKSIDASNTSGGSAQNQKIAAFAKRMGTTGQLYGQKNQVEGQLEDKQRIINTQTENANIDTMNQFNEATRGFKNNQMVERMNNMSNVSTDAMQMFKDNKMFEMDKQRMELYGTMSPNALAQWDTEFGKQSLKSQGFEAASEQFKNHTGTANIETLNRLFMDIFGKPFRS
jgi:hypothetical protein